MHPFFVYPQPQSVTDCNWPYTENEGWWAKSKILNPPHQFKKKKKKLSRTKWKKKKPVYYLHIMQLPRTKAIRPDSNLQDKHSKCSIDLRSKWVIIKL